MEVITIRKIHDDYLLHSAIMPYLEWKEEAIKRYRREAVEDYEELKE